VRHTGRVAAPLALAALGACADRVTAPRPETGTTVIRWNILARELVIADRMPPPKASRAYAYLSVAQYGSALAAHDFRPGVFPSAALGHLPFGRTEAAIATASARILSVMFPQQTARIAHELQADVAALRGRSATRSAIEFGKVIGGEVAASLEARASTDGADIEWSGSLPNGTAFWGGADPLLPAWGLVKPWLWSSGSELRAAPPPSFDSETFRAALAEVRQIADTRTPTQLEIARFWADGAGTYTPPGHWNELAADLIRSSSLGDLHAARTMALVNLAMMDAVIGCWDTKYSYWVVRPYQADPEISTPIGQPPHPSYPSGHACSSGAAAGVLASLFPARAAELEHLAVEACDSRVYAGIHYRFDAEAGMKIGEEAAARTLERADALVRSEIARAFSTANE
jgi:membrane-associated phospholipid phosphatase